VTAHFVLYAVVLQVIVGAHGVLANGGVIATCGMHMVALAARHNSTPFVVLVGLHKLSPLFPHQPEVANNGE
jgi:translation initiation factor eIF-2B subunit beta